MNMQKSEITRALVLGGGGVTGMAWEIGVLCGLVEAGMDPQMANAIIGTSAGAFVGAAVASGYDMRRYYRQQLQINAAEPAVHMSRELYEEWIEAFRRGGSDREKVGAEFGAIALRHPEPVSASLRRSVVDARLVTQTWPSTLQVTAIHAATGALHLLDEFSGLSLSDAVSASGAVPGIWPPVALNSELWIDGGMVSAANARLAQSYNRVVILAPMPHGYGAIPGAAEDAAALQADGAQAVLVTPNPESMNAIGANPYDPERAAAAAMAGREQSRQIASLILEMWQLV